METVVTVILLLVAFSFVLKLTFHSRAGVIITSVVAALTVGLSQDWAITQSKTQIQDWLSQPDLMLDTAVLLTIDVALQLAYCVIEAKVLAGGTLTRAWRWIKAALLWIPGILIFPALAVMLVTLIFSLPGSDFETVAWTAAAAVLVGCPLLAWLMSYIMDEAETRLELIFLLNSLIAVLGIIATVNGRTAAVGVSEVDWLALTGVLAILACGLIAGLIMYRKRKLK